MEYLIAVRQRVLQELTGIEAIQAVLAGKPDLAVYTRYPTSFIMRVTARRSSRLPAHAVRARIQKRANICCTTPGRRWATSCGRSTIFGRSA